MTSINSQSTLLNLVRYTVLVMLFCYLPHLLTFPWWLTLVILAAMGYRLLADYYNYPHLSLSIRVLLIIFCFSLLKIHYATILSNGFFIGFLLIFIGLKLIETYRARDIKVLILCHFYLIFTALITIQEFWILFYLVIAVVANFSLMIKLNAPEASLAQIGGNSIKQLLIAIPLSLILFFLFPRLANPLWQVPDLSSNATGFSETMNPGSISQLFNDDRTAFRVSFKNKPINNGYWRGLILNFYDGKSWSSIGYPKYGYLPLPTLKADTAGDYEIILEPNQTKWLFYLEYPESGRPDLVFSADYGLMQNNKKPIMQRFAYALKGKTQPYRRLTTRELQQNIQLPTNLNPRLQSWAKTNFEQVQQNPKAFINFLKGYIKQQPFWYTLSPPTLDHLSNQMDYFWFDSQKGFCEHYASALTIILRSVGIPARVIVGYQGGEWNSVGHFLNMQQSSAHAWLEYWQEGIGWQEFDPTHYISWERIDKSIHDRQMGQINDLNLYTDFDIGWLQRSRLFFQSLRFFTERWLLFYNQDTQHDLLQQLGLESWGIRQLLQMSVASLVIFFILLGGYYQVKRWRSSDQLLREYRLLQKEFQRAQVATPPSATLHQQCQALVCTVPHYSSLIELFLYRYEKLRLQQDVEVTAGQNKKDAITLFRNLRKRLRETRPQKTN